MFGPDDSVGWYTRRDQARSLVGCAVDHVACGSDADLWLAKQAVNQAIRLFMMTGLTRDQAIQQVVSFARMLGALE
jgi:hypothetical protein